MVDLLANFSTTDLQRLQAVKQVADRAGEIRISAKRRLADEYHAAQERGEVATRSKP
jgi:hypothetical protein